jgi:UDP-glucose 4-epimerase
MVSVKIKGSTILITGGAGFIGSHLAEEYLESGAEKVVIFDDFSTGSAGNLEHLTHEGLVVVKGSIMNAALLDRTVKKEKVEIIDHEAAQLEVYTGIRNSLRDARINIFGTLNVLNTALKNKVGKVLFASSGAVYGEAKHLPVNEGHPLAPHWPYGVSKLSGERYCLQYYLLYGLNTTSFRYSIVYGPREWYGRVLTMFIKRIFIENKPPVVFGSGQQVRDFVYVKDLVKAHGKAVESPKASGKVFNLSSEEGISMKELAESLIQLSGRKLRTIFDNPQEGKASSFQPERVRLKGELKRFVLSNEKAKKILSWSPSTEFKNGVSKEVEWLRRNHERWEVRPRV